MLLLLAPPPNSLNLECESAFWQLWVALLMVKRRLKYASEAHMIA